MLTRRMWSWGNPVSMLFKGAFLNYSFSDRVNLAPLFDKVTAETTVCLLSHPQ